jgi:hypothetical protein
MRNSLRPIVFVCGLPLLCSGLGANLGCMGSAVQNGALIGAASGAIAGAGTGLLISNHDLLGSEASKAHGDIELSSGESIATGLAMGAVVGAIVGAMVGHVHERPPADADVLPGDNGKPSASADHIAPRAF